MKTDRSKLKRDLNRMPDFVKSAMWKRKLTRVYRERPAYQQNDYIGWIVNVKREATKQKRLRQMLDELETGGVYMGMKHEPSKKK